MLHAAPRLLVKLHLGTFVGCLFLLALHWLHDGVLANDETAVATVPLRYLPCQVITCVPCALSRVLLAFQRDLLDYLIIVDGSDAAIVCVRASVYRRYAQLRALVRSLVVQVRVDLLLITLLGLW